MTLRSTTSALALATALALPSAGWAIGPDYQRPASPLTTPFRAAPPATGATASLETWWLAFDDPGLTRIVERVRAQNLDLAQARARVLRSRAAAHAAGAALLPRLDGQAGIDKTQQSLQSPIGEIGRHLPGFERDYTLYDAGLSASWEIDLFGGLRREREAARAEAVGTNDRAEGLRVSLTAEAADAYLTARGLQARLDVARRREAVQRDLVDLLQRQAAEGVAPERELHQAQAAWQDVRASIPPLTASLDAQVNRLDVLMGAQPGTDRAELERPAAIPAAPAIAADSPAGLLRRRPDVLAAEERLIAANARIGAALSEYYPKVSLAGLVGGESIDSRSLFAADAIQSQIGAGLRWRLFDFGRIDAEVAAARGQQAEDLAAYRLTILRAAEEVENAFTDLAQQRARAAALAREVDHLTIARDQTQDAYAGGVVSLIEVRDVDRGLLAASDQLAQAQAGAARAAVAAFRALGGGWTAPAALRKAERIIPKAG
jgi:NodT family efflux transporter outer membrane factor (OMF) lipoprotein